jgi:hypothetical protein
MGITALLEAREQMPENTRSAYEPKQQEFIQWAIERGYPDHATVTAKGPRIPQGSCSLSATATTRDESSCW